MDQVLQVLQVLRIKGRATPETLATVVGTDVTDDDRAVRAGRDSSTTPESATGSPKSGADESTSCTQVSGSRPRPLILDVYETFVPINDEVKQIVTDWQMRVVDGQIVLNDHQDRSHDDGVIARLHDIDAKAAPALESLTSALPRFDSYSRRLQRALAEIRGGDHTMVAAPIKDSYHTVWFELHEDLLLLSGRERKES